MKKQIALILASLLCSSSIAACGDNTDVSTETGAQTDAQTEVVTETTEAPILHNVPDTFDYGGKNLNFFMHTLYPNYSMAQQEESGDNVETAIYRANRAVTEALNCTFTFTDMSRGDNSLMRNTILADDQSMDAAFPEQYTVTALILEHMLYDITEAPYIDLDQPWWHGAYNAEALTPNGQLFIASGDVNTNTFRMASSLVMNTTLMRDRDLDSDAVMKSVLDGSWTWDKFEVLQRGIYTDVNGDGKADEGDVYGIACTTMSIVDHLIIDSGIRVTERGTDQVPKIIINNERTDKCLRNISELFIGNPNMYYVEGCNFAQFLGENRVLFLPILMYMLEGYRDVETDYSVIPMPKLDESVESYSALVHDGSTVVCMPSNCANPEIVSAAIELLSYEGYMNVMPEYYEISLKQKYLRDTDDAATKIIDLIHESLTTDFGYVYNQQLATVLTGMRNVSTSSSFGLASYYAKLEKRLNNSYEKLLSAMNEES